ncbi:hypothetical protein RhiirA4_512153 [Rhizophagus irregularis]|uniref:Uncharacterized protein n=1 Tax=Rhizophagus irregularis TaxID=588596 RepID=A0A2I1GBN7_9GLOM|nr:hypothetical protein RhiirA4_512153 [Rhizophagus irregularis]
MSIVYAVMLFSDSDIFILKYTRDVILLKQFGPGSKSCQPRFKTSLQQTGLFNLFFKNALYFYNINNTCFIHVFRQRLARIFSSDNRLCIGLMTSRGEIGKRPKKAKNTGFGKIKTCLALNWVIRLRPKFTTFWSLISSVVLQKIGSTALLLFQKFPKDRSGPIKDRRTD